jgi:FkbM family methyltransferase
MLPYSATISLPISDQVWKRMFVTKKLSGKLWLKRTIKKLLNSAGLDLVTRNKNPAYTLLGLRDRPIKTVLDIGANVGQSAKRFRGRFPEARLYCFEPLPDAYAALKSWADGQAGTVQAFNVALGDRSGSFDMFHHVDHAASSSLLETTDTATALYPQKTRQETVSVPLKTLDELRDELDLKGEVLIKLDVQGFELNVIAGGAKTIAEANALILEVSLMPLYVGQARFDALVAELSNLGHDYAGNLDQVFAPDGSVVFIDALFVQRAPDTG